jgi:hypothetical protein
MQVAINANVKNLRRCANSFIESLLPETATKLDSFVTNVSYEFEAEPGLIPRLFEEIEARKKQNGVDDWGLSQTT